MNEWAGYMAWSLRSDLVTHHWMTPTVAIGHVLSTHIRIKANNFKRIAHSAEQSHNGPNMVPKLSNFTQLLRVLCPLLIDHVK